MDSDWATEAQASAKEAENDASDAAQVDATQVDSLPGRGAALELMEIDDAIADSTRQDTANNDDFEPFFEDDATVSGDPWAENVNDAAYMGLGSHL